MLIVVFILELEIEVKWCDDRGGFISLDSFVE